MQVASFEAILARGLKWRGAKTTQILSHESDCTLTFGFKFLLKSISCTKTVKFVSTFLEYLETAQQVLRDCPVHVRVVFGNGGGLMFMSFYTIM